MSSIPQSAFRTPHWTSVVERLADEMAARWQAGDRPLAEEFLAPRPDLAAHPAAVLDLVAEELALRDEHAEPTTADALAARFPHLPEQVRALVACQRALGPRPAPPAFPAPGGDLGEFRLLALLGRGVVGRVFLASQGSLGYRPVVLKVTPDRGHEHLSLARLQHTNIVPLYSAHDFPDLRLRALCLPYFGSATLADLPAQPVGSGANLVVALRTTQAGAAVRLPAGGPACDFLAQSSAVEAACWVGAGLADALQYAHDRGLLHLDLKPSNVLIAADGVPMLLDFHLARPPLAAGDPPPDWLGGTPGYMAPEQEAAVDAVRHNRPVAAAVDGRADVYSLGVLLAQMVGPAGAVPVGVRDILARCTAADPAGRYPTAAALAGDLRRHLADLPLKGVGNRSVAERWRKWRRRRPHALPLGLALLSVAAGVGAWAARTGRQWDGVETAVENGERLLARGKYPEAVEAFRGAEALADGWPGRGGLGTRLRDGLREARRGQAAADLHRFVARVMPLYGGDESTSEHVRLVADECRKLWDRRDELVPLGATDDLLDLAVLSAHLAVRAAPSDETPGAGQTALTILTDAEQLLGPSRWLLHERAAIAGKIGRPDAARDAQGRVREMPLRTARDFLALGRSLLEAGEPGQAAAALDRALALDPASPWANYHRGLCSHRLGEPADAVAAFTACLALAPESAWCWYNRGLAFAAAGRPSRARADFEKALHLDPKLTAAEKANSALAGQRD